MGTRWHDLEGRGRVQARLKLPLCLTDLETARFAIARLHRPPPTTRLILRPRHKELSSSPGIIAALRGILQMEFPRLQGTHQESFEQVSNGFDPSSFFFSFLDSLPAMNRLATRDADARAFEALLKRFEGEVEFV